MYIIKYGGSRISPTADSYDEGFIAELIELVKKYSNKRFMIIVGGGALCRKMQEKMTTKKEKDLVGIEATRINAKYVIEKIKQANLDVYPEVLKDPTQNISENHQIYFSGGWKPGNSTDYVTMRYAVTFNADKVIKVSDFTYVKDISPLELKDLSKGEREKRLAQTPKLKIMTWQKMVDLVGETWIPGLHTPLDPLAAKLGLQHRDISLYIIPEKEIEKVLAGEDFQGTVVNS